MNDSTPWQGMQFGIFSVSDITQNPTNGSTPSEASKIRDTVTVAKHAEQVGLDVEDEPGRPAAYARQCLVDDLGACPRYGAGDELK